MQYIVVNGQGGCGKDTFEAFCRQICEENGDGFAKFSIIDPIKDLAKSIVSNDDDALKTSSYRKLLSDLKIACESYNNYPMETLLRNIHNDVLSEDAFVFVDLREKKDIDFFCNFFYDVKKLLIIRGEPKNYGNSADDEVFNDIDYDFIIENNGSLIELKRKANILINELKGAK